jgi:hypothetical protein
VGGGRDGLFLHELRCQIQTLQEEVLHLRQFSMALIREVRILLALLAQKVLCSLALLAARGAAASTAVEHGVDTRGTKFTVQKYKF